MRSKSRTLQDSIGSGSSPLVKPEPREDLWQRISDELDVLKEIPVDRPEGSFTANEFALKFNVSTSGAFRRIRKLKLAGKIEKFGHGPMTYYIMK